MPHKRPRSFAYNLVVIGAGSAGLVASLIASTLKAKVALIEAERMGGDCLNTGCVPSKALLRSAKVIADARRAPEFGLRSAAIDYDFGEVMDRVQAVIREIAPHDSVERFTGLGVECIQGRARVIDPWRVAVGDRELTTRNIIIATGSRPRIPKLPGIEACGYLTTDTLWDIRERPGRLLIMGAGAIGCELSQAFARLDCDVTLVLRGPRLLPKEDPQVGELVRKQLELDGVTVLSGHTPLRVEPQADGSHALICRQAGNGEEVTIPFDRLLPATGRRPTIAGLGLEELGVRLSDNGSPQCNRFLQTSIPSIYCAGDVAGPYLFTHTASHQAWYASVNALFGGIKRFKVDYRIIPWVTFTDPEVARVGLNQSQAAQQHIPFELTTYPLSDSDRAIADSDTAGFIEVLTVPGRDRILGVTLVGRHAGELLAEFVLAMKHGLGLNKILATIHPYPTLGEANKASAGLWRKAHAPKTLLKGIRRLQKLRRTPLF